MIERKNELKKRSAHLVYSHWLFTIMTHWTWVNQEYRLYSKRYFLFMLHVVFFTMKYHVLWIGVLVFLAFIQRSYETKVKWKYTSMILEKKNDEGVVRKILVNSDEEYMAIFQKQLLSLNQFIVLCRMGPLPIQSNHGLLEWV